MLPSRRIVLISSYWCGKGEPRHTKLSLNKNMLTNMKTHRIDQFYMNNLPIELSFRADYSILKTMSMSRQRNGNKMTRKLHLPTYDPLYLHNPHVRNIALQLLSLMWRECIAGCQHFKSCYGSLLYNIKKVSLIKHRQE